MTYYSKNSKDCDYTPTEAASSDFERICPPTENRHFANSHCMESVTRISMKKSEALFP